MTWNCSFFLGLAIVFLLMRDVLVAQQSSSELVSPIDLSVEGVQIKGTFGDLRRDTPPGTPPTLQKIHGGVDIHWPVQPGPIVQDSPVKPVISEMILLNVITDDQQNPNEVGLELAYFDNLSDGTLLNVNYLYGHLHTQFLEDGNVVTNWLDFVNLEPFYGSPDDHLDSDGNFSQLRDFSTDPNDDYRDHLHFGIKEVDDQTGDQTLHDPLYEAGTEKGRYLFLDVEDSIAPTILNIEFMLNNRSSNDYTTSYPWWGIPPLADEVDIAVLVTDRNLNDPEHFDQKVGVNEVWWQAQFGFNAGPFSDDWIRLANFATDPPEDDDVDEIYVIDPSPLKSFSDPEIQGSGELDVNTEHSGNDDDHIDKMWYVPTNSFVDDNGNFDLFYAARWEPEGLGTHTIWIRAVDSHGNATQKSFTVEVSDATGGTEFELPSTFLLSDAYPNPFNPSTKLNFEIPQPSEVTFQVYNEVGQEVKELFHSFVAPGRYDISWDGTNQSGSTVASGVYFIRMHAKTVEDSRSFVFSSRVTFVK